jgi:hypothetical protein
MRSSLLLLCVAAPAAVEALATGAHVTALGRSHKPAAHHHHHHHHHHRLPNHLRGGGKVSASLLSGALTGSLAVPAATGIAAAAGTLAYIHQAYIFSL